MRRSSGRCDRVCSHPKLRHEQIVGAVRLYGITVPSRFSLGEVEVNRDRAAFSISEQRLSVTWMSDMASVTALMALAKWSMVKSGCRLLARC